MKGDQRVIDSLNALLQEELTAINQYFVHAEMCEDWKYSRLHSTIRERSITEMRHAEKLIERILYLEGQPIVSNLSSVSIGKDVSRMLESDLNLEKAAVRQYNDAIRLAVEAGDNGTRDMLQAILADEEEHIDLIEAYFNQIEQLGVQGFLQQQIY